MNGYIGFFDILGYQSFLKNTTNDNEQKRILQEIVAIRNSIPSSVRTSGPEKLPSGLNKIINEIQWIIFSDTIVFAIEESTVIEHTLYQCITAFTTVKHLMTRMFNYGFPLRGALHYGQYNVIESCMAGTGILEAHDAGQNLDLSGCVLTQPLIAKWESVSNSENTFLNEISCDYAVPVSGNKIKKQKCLMWFGKDDEDKKMQSDEIKNILKEDKYDLYVRNAFWKHNKTVSDSKTKRKLKETERFIRYCVSEQK